MRGMSATAVSLVRGGTVIVPPRTKPTQVKFRWPPDLQKELAAIAEKTNRSINETGELLMRWAIERAKAELDMGDAGSPVKRKKQ